MVATIHRTPYVTHIVPAAHSGILDIQRRGRAGDSSPRVRGSHKRPALCGGVAPAERERVSISNGGSKYTGTRAECKRHCNAEGHLLTFRFWRARVLEEGELTSLEDQRQRRTSTVQ
jgi:hypothetical protein